MCLRAHSHSRAIIDDTCMQRERGREEERERKERGKKERKRKEDCVVCLCESAFVHARAHAHTHTHTHTGLRDMLRSAVFGRAHLAMQTHLSPILHPQVSHSTKLLLNSKLI